MSKHIDGHREGDEIAIGEITVQDDLKRNPGIGQSKGLEGASEEDIDAVAADSTAEGDVANEVRRPHWRHQPEAHGSHQQVSGRARAIRSGLARAGRRHFRSTAMSRSRP